MPLWLALPAALWLVVCFLAYAPWLLWPCSGGRSRAAWRARLANRFGRAWGRGVLRLAGLRVELRGERALLATRPAVFVINHTSLLDFFVLTELMPEHTLALGKQELGRIPLLGWFWAWGGHPLIERDNRRQWEQVLSDLTQRLESREWSVVIAPEGTRSRDGSLGPFKKGPFVIALEAQVPLIPLVIHGAAGGLGRSSQLEAELLAPCDPSGWTRAELGQRVDEVRSRFLAALGQEPQAERAGI